MYFHPRILAVDDHAAIHGTSRKVLCPEGIASAVGELEASLFQRAGPRATFRFAVGGRKPVADGKPVT